jgi:hypothetical protein
MVFEKAGINITALQNVEPLNMTYSFTPSNILPSMVGVLSESYGMWISLIIYSALLLILYWALSEQSPFATFRYSYIRALVLSILLINLLSITALSVGFIHSFRVVAIFMILNMIFSMIVLSLDNPN